MPTQKCGETITQKIEGDDVSEWFDAQMSLPLLEGKISRDSNLGASINWLLCHEDRGRRLRVFSISCAS